MSSALHAWKAGIEPPGKLASSRAASNEPPLSRCFGPIVARGRTLKLKAPS